MFAQLFQLTYLWLKVVRMELMNAQSTPAHGGAGEDNTKFRRLQHTAFGNILP
jgi:hypothetical protein